MKAEPTQTETIAVLTLRLIGLGLVAAIGSAQQPARTQARAEFEVASIKRNLSGSRPWLVPPAGDRFSATNVTLKMLISLGWGVQNYAVSGGPSWIDTEGYDVTAKEPEPDLSTAEFSLMLRSLLQDRFGLRIHNETREAPVYVLTLDRNGLRLPEADPEPCLTFAIHGDPRELRADPAAACGGMSVTPGSIADEKVTMAWFASVLQAILKRPVLDHTGFPGSFKLHLEFAPVNSDADSDGSKPSLFAALQEQLGLRLESTKGSAEVLVIDSVKRPSEN